MSLFMYMLVSVDIFVGLFGHICGSLLTSLWVSLDICGARKYVKKGFVKIGFVGLFGHICESLLTYICGSLFTYICGSLLTYVARKYVKIGHICEFYVKIGLNMSK